MQKTIIGFGASSVEGVGDDAGGGFIARLQRAVPSRRFVNMGIGGDTSREMLQRRDRLHAYRPYDLIVLLGCNDMPRTNDGNSARRTGLDEYRDNLRLLLGDLRGERSIFVTSFPVDPARSGIAADVFAEYMACARHVSIACGYEVLDLYAAVVASRRDHLAPDGIHFNAEGHRLIAELLMPVIDP